MMDEPAEIDFSMVLASSVHDMKNSVGMLLVSLEAAIREQPPENEHQTTRVATLQYEASRINSELIQLLTIYRLQNRHLPVRIDQHYVLDLMEEQLARNHMLIEMRGIAVEVDCDPDLEWYFDSHLLGSLVQNVLVNGVRYTRSRLLIRAEIVNDRLRIMIADDGPGYPPRMLADPAAAMEDPSAAPGSTHLGLYFARCIARLHRRGDECGSIELVNESPLGGGAFNVFLP